MKHASADNTKAQVEVLLPRSIPQNKIFDFLSRAFKEYPDIVDAPDTLWATKIHDYADIICIRNQRKEIDGAIFCYCNDTTSKTAFITFICTLPACPKGTAYQLCLQYEKLSRERGMQQQLLEVKKSNLHALQFYIRQGYQIVEDRKERKRWLLKRMIPNN